ncbi:hypothetical protein K466DRAFT_596790 [Polyporus arcularius HHB13444]|uniref:Shieldin complex subunit 2 first OB fold domain-containing protein n=1 Tax=Polyporus arcularius HHB13444 TaxID=1314778 RepID=A0A5C3PNV8_9APHY|nr:hypothetical protein K466DRAFT_596790 [Polyporus arcularius HHB13444]
MTRYRLFYGAPAAKDLASPRSSYSWQTITPHRADPLPLTLPPSTLAAASRRISMLYEKVIFKETGDEQDLSFSAEDADDTQPEGITTVITWPATTQGGDTTSRSRTDITFLRPSASVSRVRSELVTQQTQDTGSYDFSDASSIANFPAFHFSLHGLTPLAALLSQAETARASHAHKGSRKVHLLVAVLEIEGPDSIRVKRGPDAGKEVSLLKLVLGDESGGICKLSAWREVAEDWAGLNPDTHASSQPVKKGDIVFLENILVSWDPELSKNAAAVPISCSASPQLKSRLEVCYRAMPSVPQDARLRPDLRLGLSDAVVRRVASVVRWFEGMAGLL